MMPHLTKLMLLGGCLAACQARAVTTAEVFLHVDPAKDEYYRVAHSNPLTISWEFPEGATKAIMRTDTGVSQSAQELTETSLSVGIGPVVNTADERVVDLSLSFDDPAGSAQSATLVFLADGATVQNPDGRGWQHLRGSAVFPIPADVTALTIAGERNSLNEIAPTWRWFPGRNDGSTVEVALDAGGRTYVQDLICSGVGFLLIFR